MLMPRRSLKTLAGISAASSMSAVLRLARGRYLELLEPVRQPRGTQRTSGDATGEELGVVVCVADDGVTTAVAGKLEDGRRAAPAGQVVFHRAEAGRRLLLGGLAR
jgi:hypothetical protein